MLHLSDRVGQAIFTHAVHVPESFGPGNPTVGISQGPSVSLLDASTNIKLSGILLTRLSGKSSFANINIRNEFKTGRDV